MTTIDFVILGLILWGGYRGYTAGFLMSIITLTAVVLGVIGGFKLLGNAMLLLDENFKVNGGILPYLAFAVVFVGIVILVSLLGRFLKSSIDQSFLGRVDQAMGAIIGIFKFAFIASILIWLISSVSVAFPLSWTRESVFFPIIQGFAPLIVSWLSEVFPTLKDTL